MLETLLKHSHDSRSDLAALRAQGTDTNRRLSEHIEHSNSKMNVLASRVEELEASKLEGGLDTSERKHLTNLQRGVTRNLRNTTNHVVVFSNWESATGTVPSLKKAREKKIAELATACSGITIRNYEHGTDKDGKLTPYTKATLSNSEQASKLAKYCASKKMSNPNGKPIYSRIDVPPELRAIQRPLNDFTITLRKALKEADKKGSVNIRGNSAFCGNEKVADLDGLGNLGYCYEGDDTTLATILDKVALQEAKKSTR